jgi:L-methionine (R)-S-oxide reductase
MRTILNHDGALRQITEVLNTCSDRTHKSSANRRALRLSGNYRWVGIYDVDEHKISVIAWSGIGAPAHPSFGIEQGLSGEAVRMRNPVISNDVENDPRYLTAFGNTQSEMIIPVFAEANGPIVGTIDVESEKKNAFDDQDCVFLKECAKTLAHFWS